MQTVCSANVARFQASFDGLSDEDRFEAYTCLVGLLTPQTHCGPTLNQGEVDHDVEGLLVKTPMNLLSLLSLRRGCLLLLCLQTKCCFLSKA